MNDGWIHDGRARGTRSGKRGPVGKPSSKDIRITDERRAGKAACRVSGRDRQHWPGMKVKWACLARAWTEAATLGQSVGTYLAWQRRRGIWMPRWRPLQASGRDQGHEVRSAGSAICAADIGESSCATRPSAKSRSSGASREMVGDAGAVVILKPGKGRRPTTSRDLGQRPAVQIPAGDSGGHPGKTCHGPPTAVQKQVLRDRYAETFLTA